MNEKHVGEQSTISGLLRRRALEPETTSAAEIYLNASEKTIMVDNLTGCFNQTYFEHKFKSQDFDIDHNRDKVAIIYLDMNNLKQVNDNKGHRVGDQFIVDFANFLKSQFRDIDDTVIRLHGDEFIVVCRDRVHQIKYEDIRLRLNAIRANAVEKIPDITFASGLASFDSELHDGKLDMNLEDTESRADKEMYKNKRSAENPDVTPEQSAI